jgi:hypothetical protein
MTDTCRDLLDQVEPKDLTQIALQMLFTIERMELIIPEITDTIRKALEQARPTVEPVPVSERLPRPEDCDAEGRCWWEFEGSDDYEPCWALRKMHGIPFCRTRWLPHYALSTPEANS